MAAYRKSPQQSYDSRTSPHSHDQMLAPPPPVPINYGYQDQSPSYSSHSQHSHNSSPHFTHDAPQPQQSFVTDSPYQSSIYNAAAAAAPIPEIAGSGPQQGATGSDFTIYLTSTIDLTTDTRGFKVMFGSKRCAARMEKQMDANGFTQYALIAKVPPMTITGWNAHTMPVFLQVEDAEQNELSTEQVTEFTYTDASPRQAYTTSPPLPSLHKRKASEDTRFDAVRGDSKKTAVHSDMKKADDYSNYSYPPAPNTTYSGYNQDRGYPYYDQASRPVNSNINTRTPSLPFSSSSFDSGNEALPYSQTAQGQSWNSGIYQASPQSVTSAIGHAPQLTNPLPSPSDSQQPTLVRTSTIQMHNTPQPGSNGFNPYGIMPHKAVLKLQGNLDSMAEQWTEEEWQNRRRLVQFWRQQKGSQIHTSFAPVSQTERQSNSTCISCIWWAEKNAAYVTSVDCIYLLEQLIAVRFTVEEKNRIRRNLEGFHPLTVSKGKADSENFFKLIMGFPNPKPRNIEKDVKVFPWKILSLALKKIIGKYSASYASTASLVSPAPAGYLDASSHERPSSASGAGGSPHSTASSAPHHDMSPKHFQRSPMNRNTPPVHNVSVPPVPQQPSQMWPHHAQLPQPQQAAPRSAWDMPQHRGSLDLSAYLDTSPATANPHYQHLRPQDNSGQRGPHSILH